MALQVERCQEQDAPMEDDQYGPQLVNKLEVSITTLTLFKVAAKV